VIRALRQLNAECHASRRDSLRATGLGWGVRLRLASAERASMLVCDKDRGLTLTENSAERASKGWRGRALAERVVLLFAPAN
jgi:hypothetical protein